MVYMALVDLHVGIITTKKISTFITEKILIKKNIELRHYYCVVNPYRVC